MKPSFEEVCHYTKEMRKKYDVPSMEFNKAIADKFSGESCQTGGDIYVTYIPIDSRHCIGVTDESVVLYESTNDYDSPSELGMAYGYEDDIKEVKVEYLV